MNYRIIHELPRRIRVFIDLPKRHTPDNSQIEGLFLVIEGVEKTSFNCLTRSLLVIYNGNSDVRHALLKTTKEVPLTFVKKENLKRHVGAYCNTPLLKQKKRAAILAGGLLIARPIIPHILMPLFALYGAIPIFKKGLSAILNKRLNVDVLDSTAIGISLGRGDYLSASVITFFLKVGHYLEEWLRQRSRESLSKMLQSASGGIRWVWVKRNGRETRIGIKDVAVGDVVVVRVGSSIPVDGVVVEGEATVNQSSLTGEPLPLPKRKGSRVYAETAVEEGSLTIEAVNVGDETRVSRVIKVIEESEGLKADVQSHAERLANKVVPYTFLLSGVVYLFTGNPVTAASLLLVDYSCAIRLSTPLAIMWAMITAARRGILIKGGKFVEKLAETNACVLDKTGTLTEARPTVVEVIPFNGFSRNYILKNAACVEEHFPHPIASAVVKRAEEEGLQHKEVHAEVEYVVAHGIASRIKGKRILVGSRHFLYEDHGINVKCIEPVINNFTNKGYSILYVAIDNALGGIIAIEDNLREESQRFLEMLKGSGVERIIMVTGDYDATARNVAKRIGIEEFYSQVFPEKKVEIIKRLKNEGYVVAMVGDGINDSPALSYADVGISMTHGADIAKEACDVLLLDTRLERIIEARKIAKDAMFRIKQNFKYIIGINTALIGLGILGVTTPVVSAFVHNAMTLLISANSIKPYHLSLYNEKRGWEV